MYTMNKVHEFKLVVDVVSTDNYHLPKFSHFTDRFQHVRFTDQIYVIDVIKLIKAF